MRTLGGEPHTWSGVRTSVGRTSGVGGGFLRVRNSGGEEDNLGRGTSWGENLGGENLRVEKPQPRSQGFSLWKEEYRG